ncbi:cell wall metabolism sensor histidine kinase WalK [Kibdelosporangium persicum]|uniref:histidine kinase n=1 Tax=Kibdelosporangium persicum TaxID=2698649 RepID=A0ABX2FBG7_9PSEU|nr:HAMP domain-containing sensor histidine kinase [Kibdelosporangium persicum]NRN68709.1 Integral membrane sensor signal transduction histidine kinase [Kibdelosporangium persicum]
MSLRTRLILTVLGLLALGLFIALGATWGALQDWKSNRSADELLSRSLNVALISGGVALLAVGVLSWHAVRRGLRPLDDIADTAAEIGSGDLSRRVPGAPANTEIGKLSTALNGMLARLEASEDRLRRFVADASHELRTPIATIRGHAELFRRGAASRPDDLAKVMRRIEAEAERMGLLVDELLLLARLDQGRPLERSPVDLPLLATDAVTDALATDPSRDISVEAAPVTVLGDSARLRQVLGNLLSNVLQHTDSPATVRVFADGPRAVIEVRDSGPGIAEPSRVFERFYRASESRTHGGAGLGLSIVAAVVEAHGGTVAVESELGKGSTFTVSLPYR